MLISYPMLHPTAWLVSVLAAGGLFAAAMTGAAHADADAAPKKISRVAQPTIIIEKEGACVEPEDVMRRDHMKFILHQRDKTMHQGVRTEKYSLKNCVNCHANSKTNSVVGKDGFCVSCHSYAAVSIDCFSCHTSTAEKNSASLNQAVTDGKAPEHAGQTMVPAPVIKQKPVSTGKAP
jgi:hypothetical protein